MHLRTSCHPTYECGRAFFSFPLPFPPLPLCFPFSSLLSPFPPAFPPALPSFTLPPSLKAFLDLFSKGSDWPNMHTDPFFALFPVLIECRRLYIAIRARHEWQQGSGTLWLSIRAIKPKWNDNFTCSNPNFSKMDRH